MLLKLISCFVFLLNTVSCIADKHENSNLSGSSESEITVVSWGGEYSNAQETCVYPLFTKKTGINVKRIDYHGDMKKLKKVAESDGKKEWDIIDLPMAGFHLALKEGWIEPIADDLIPQVEQADFVEGAIIDGGAASVAWASVIAFNLNEYKDMPLPKTLQDFWDIEKYPGKRGMGKHAQPNLEQALMADGVSREDVYKVLSTKEGVDRAFKKLDELRPHIVWWSNYKEAIDHLKSSKVTMTTVVSGRAYAAIREYGKNPTGTPVKIIWDGQVYGFNYWGIVKGTDNLKGAKEFIKAAISTKACTAMVNRLAYGPTRKSVWKNIQPEVRKNTPTFEPNMKTALALDAKFWMENQERLDRRFQEWADGKSPTASENKTEATPSTGKSMDKLAPKAGDEQRKTTTST